MEVNQLDNNLNRVRWKYFMSFTVLLTKHISYNLYDFTRVTFTTRIDRYSKSCGYIFLAMDLSEASLVLCINVDYWHCVKHDVP